MTPAQQRVVDAIKHKMTHNWMDPLIQAKYELKRFDVTEEGWCVQVIAESGLKDDEGTMAAIFCRDKVQIFISPRGSCSTYVKGKRKSSLRVRGNLFKVFNASHIDNRR